MWKEFKITGDWWFHDTPKIKYEGELSFHPETGIKLIFANVKGPYFMGLINRGNDEIILGKSNKEKIFTLYSGFKTNHAEFHIKIIFENSHYYSLDEIRFSKIAGMYTGVNEWISINSDNNRKILDSSESEKFQINLGNIGKGYSASIEVHKSNHEREIELEQMSSTDSYLVISKNFGDEKYEVLSNKLGEFSTFHLLCIGEVNFPLKIIGYPKDCRTEPNKPPVLIYRNHLESFSNIKVPKEGRVLLLLNDLDKAKIKRWFVILEKYNQSIYNYRSLFFKSRLFVQNKFINVLKALELIHREFYEPYKINEVEYQKLREIIKSEITEPHKEPLLNMLGSYRHKSLRGKLEDLLLKAPKELSKLLLVNDLFKTPEEFIDTLVTTRNIVTHGKNDRKSKRFITDNSDFYYVSLVLSIFYQFYFLKMLKFRNSKAVDLISIYSNDFLTKSINHRVPPKNSNFPLSPMK